MALAAVFFTFPIAIAFAIAFSILNGLGLTELAVVYITTGSGMMAAFLVAVGVASIMDRH